jgi:amidase/aspartyl-tRNA(Asn)/glutamyl-tRNA(Gln) amidotransferase subunit A
MALADELAYMPTTEMAARIRRRELSSVEAVGALGERIEQRNPSLNAFVFLALDEARERAREADAALASGADVGMLHGVPTAMKDLFDYKPGWPVTLGGVRALADWRTSRTCAFVEKVEAAGAIVLGRTNAPVMGMRGVTDNPLFGPGRNPFDLARNAGGSSGGSAAAVADGLVPFAEGTDGGGSIRIPSSACGVYGFKASWGRVALTSRPDAFSFTCPFIHEGPIARTVADAALVLTVVNGYDSRDPYSLEGKQDFTDVPGRSIRGLRVAYSPNLDVFPVDPRVAAVCAEAVEAFREAGAAVEEVRLDLERSPLELSDLWCR